jgi:signal transduction histidine kinase
VTVSASTKDGQLVIAVSGTSKGNPADELPTIFDEYRQAEGSESKAQKGSRGPFPARSAVSCTMR